MRKTVSSITSLLQHLLFRVRSTERAIETLTVADLEKLARYDGTLPYTDKRVRALVWELKYYAYGKAAKLAGEYMAGMLLGEAADSIEKPLLIPMPMHKTRRRERGHNQTEVLCEAALTELRKNRSKNSLVEASSRPEDFFETVFSYAPTILTRNKHTLPQQGLERHNRLKNVKDSMIVTDAEKVKGRVCILVDDVTTTGATFEEAKRALRAAGASEVRCIALAQS